MQDLRLDKGPFGWPEDPGPMPVHEPPLLRLGLTQVTTHDACVGRTLPKRSLYRELAMKLHTMTLHADSAAIMSLLHMQACMCGAFVRKASS